MKTLRTLGLGLLLASGVLGVIRFATPPEAHAQGKASSSGGSSFTGSYSSYTATAAASSNAFIATTGAYVCLNGATCSSRLYYTAGGNIVLDAASATIMRGNGGTGLATFPFDVEVSRSLQLGTGGTAKGTCDSTNRGKLFHTRGGAGVKDNVEVCAKDAADAYAWRTLY